MLVSYLVTVGEPERALSVAKTSITKAPDDCALHRLTALVHDELGETTHAISEYREAYRLGWPDNLGELHLRVGDLLYSSGDPESARASWRKAVENAAAYRSSASYQAKPGWVRLINRVFSASRTAAKRIRDY
ncbi:MAG: tetratricopeptide repeat protein [Actinomycetota bacterium]